MAKNLQGLAEHQPAGVRRALERMCSALMLALLSLPAYADDPITRLLFKAVDLLTNQWAVGSAVVTIAAIGYRMKYGMMDKRKALVSIIGIVIVFGAVLIVDEIRT
ncbi:MAG TPA: TrbC/VirB2 family protein [Burkholderiales bacterium]|nr:TrbC/VirB2 family protein [Burkholderiales bacterium]